MQLQIVAFGQSYAATYKRLIPPFAKLPLSVLSSPRESPQNFSRGFFPFQFAALET